MGRGSAGGRADGLVQPHGIAHHHPDGPRPQPRSSRRSSRSAGCSPPSRAGCGSACRRASPRSGRGAKSAGGTASAARSCRSTPGAPLRRRRPHKAAEARSCRRRRRDLDLDLRPQAGADGTRRRPEAPASPRRRPRETGRGWMSRTARTRPSRCRRLSRRRRPTAAASRQPRRKRGGFAFPPVTLLDAPRTERKIDERELMESARLLEEKCREFAVAGSVVQIHPGPVVTTFEFKPEAGVKYSKITSLADDLSLAMRAESVLIERIARQVDGRHSDSQPAPRADLAARAARVGRLPGGAVEADRWRWARRSTASRSSATSRRCRTCSSPARRARASRSRSTPC